MAKSGLFYVGSEDYVRCFFCGTGLRNWENDDIPDFEHDVSFYDNLKAINTSRMKITKRSDDIKNVTKSLEEENRDLREQRFCKVCLDNDACIVFVSCGLFGCPGKMSNVA
ncbi:baculoviral IAP repeat-containing protein 7-like [Argopecten irradians]|uniref:baculoviral IAP repeat-containing protein 7-like n=1 Tax=Argopecten irradians TaxID=31199 RepID=UPI00371DCE0D